MGEEWNTGAKQRRGQALLAAVVPVMLAWFFMTHAYHGAMESIEGVRGVDFRDFYRAAERWNRHEPLYLPHATKIDSGYVFSPLLALALRPAARLPFETVLPAWFFVNAGFLFVGMALFARAAKIRWDQTAAVGLMLIMAFRWWPSTMNFGLGQCNFIIFALICGMYYADRKNKLWVFAACVALAALLKIWLAGLGIYLLLRRAWREAIGAAAMFVAAMAALFTIAGWDQFGAFIETTRSHSVQTVVLAHSLLGFARLHLAPNVQKPCWIDNHAVFMGFVGLGFAALAGGIYTLWRLRPRNGYESRLALGLVIVTFLLALPLSHEVYLVFCLPLLWTLIIPDEQGGGRLPLALAGLAAYAIMVPGGVYYVPVPPAYQTGWRSALLSMPFYFNAALWLLTMYALRQSWMQRNKAQAAACEPCAGANHDRVS